MCMQCVCIPTLSFHFAYHRRWLGSEGRDQGEGGGGEGEEVEFMAHTQTVKLEHFLSSSTPHPTPPPFSLRFPHLSSQVLPLKTRDKFTTRLKAGVKSFLGRGGTWHMGRKKNRSPSPSPPTSWDWGPPAPGTRDMSFFITSQDLRQRGAEVSEKKGLLSPLFTMLTPPRVVVPSLPVFLFPPPAILLQTTSLPISLAWM